MLALQSCCCYWVVCLHLRGLRVCTCARASWVGVAVTVARVADGVWANPLVLAPLVEAGLVVALAWVLRGRVGDPVRRPAAEGAA